jgi:hypothetical protein
MKRILQLIQLEMREKPGTWCIIHTSESDHSSLLIHDIAKVDSNVVMLKTLRYEIESLIIINISNITRIEVQINAYPELTDKLLKLMPDLAPFM